MPTIKRGENAIIRRNLFADDGTTPVPLSALASILAQVRQGILLEQYIYLPTPDPLQPEIREGTSDSQIEVEIMPDLSYNFREGAVTMKLIMEQTAASYAVYGKLRDIDEFEIFTVEA